MNAAIDIPTTTTLRRPSGLFVCTTLTRKTEEFGDVETDIVIEFRITHYIRGYPATWTDPAEGPEFEFEITDIYFDGGECDDAPGPVTDTERAALTAWFEGDGFDKAYESVCDYQTDQIYDRADYEYDRMRDERMESKF